jgi:hypothetical protein
LLIITLNLIKKLKYVYSTSGDEHGLLAHRCYMFTNSNRTLLNGDLCHLMNKRLFITNTHGIHIMSYIEYT